MERSWLEKALKNYREVEKIVEGMGTFQEAVDYFSSYGSYDEDYDIEHSEDEQSFTRISFDYDNINVKIYGYYEADAEVPELGGLSEDIIVISDEWNDLEDYNINDIINELK